MPVYPGEYTLDLHGAPTQVQGGDGSMLDAEDFADLVRRRTDWDGQTPIRLFSCNTGATPDGFAQQLSNALGVDVTRARFAALFVSTAMTAVGGVFIAFWSNNLLPAQIFESSRSIDIILAPIVGGLGTLFGPIVGAFLLTPLGEALIGAMRAAGLDAPGAKALVYGLMLMAIIAATPNGLWPWIARRLGLEGREP